MVLQCTSVALSVEFVNADIAQKVHYWPNTDNLSDKQWILAISTHLCLHRSKVKT